MKIESKDLKKSAAMRAMDEISGDCVLGLGSGTTMEFFIHELAERIRRERLNIVAVPTSLQARLLAMDAGITTRDPIEFNSIDLTVDGADEVDPQGNLIKGGGAAHVIEKVIAAMSKRFVVVADESKIVQMLGRNFPVPIEVIEPALHFVLKRLADLGAKPAVRVSKGKIGPVISDLGNIIVDAKFDAISDPFTLDRELNAIPGIVGHGIFVQMADRVIIGKSGPNGPGIQIIDFS